MENLKIAYIGGGSKEWANVLMGDLALCGTLCGEVALYDIDLEAAHRNAMIGARIAQDPNCISKWKYSVYPKLKDALMGADFVICSILPATFDEMEIDVNMPQKYSIYQSVGDTVGPGGVLRAMRTVPVYEEFARAIEQYCPNAFVINLTNPMSICTKTLHDVFPKIKAFGCCHEVFHAQDFLACVAKEMLGIERPNRHEINAQASGINHFTWITKASYRGKDIMALLHGFIERYFEQGYCEVGGAHHLDYEQDFFRYANKVKMDLFMRYGALGAAGDRHLVEFFSNNAYLSDENTLKRWGFHLTPVSFRKKRQEMRIALSKQYASGIERFEITRSDEELCDIIEAIVGMKTLVTNVNYVNVGQMPQMPLGTIVETDCVFSSHSISPVTASPLPAAVNALVAANLFNIEACYEGIKQRNLNQILASFVNQPLCSILSPVQAQALFEQMVLASKHCLEPYYQI